VAICLVSQLPLGFLQFFLYVLWKKTLHGFLWRDALPCHPTGSVEALNKNKSIDPHQGISPPVIILSRSAAGPLKEETLLHLRPLFNATDVNTTGNVVYECTHL